MNSPSLQSSSSHVGSGIVPVDGVGRILYGHCLYHVSPFCSITCIQVVLNTNLEVWENPVTQVYCDRSLKFFCNERQPTVYKLLMLCTKLRPAPIYSHMLLPGYQLILLVVLDKIKTSVHNYTIRMLWRNCFQKHKHIN